MTLSSKVEKWWVGITKSYSTLSVKKFVCKISNTLKLFRVQWASFQILPTSTLFVLLFWRSTPLRKENPSCISLVLTIIRVTGKTGSKCVYISCHAFLLFVNALAQLVHDSSCVLLTWIRRVFALRSRTLFKDAAKNVCCLLSPVHVALHSSAFSFLTATMQRKNLFSTRSFSVHEQYASWISSSVCSGGRVAWFTGDTLSYTPFTR